MHKTHLPHKFIKVRHFGVRFNLDMLKTHIFAWNPDVSSSSIRFIMFII
jgi:hypothetical protein